MQKRFGDTIKKNIVQWLILACVALALCFFATKKEGLNLDEVLSYQLASAEFNPFILPNQPVGRLAKYVNEEIRGESVRETATNLIATAADVISNKGSSKIMQYQADVYSEPVWISRQQYQDYMTVTEQDDFNYISVYFNTRADIHPPLYYMALHTISSAVKDSVSPMLACAANILFILGSCICLLKLMSLLEKYGTVPKGYGKYLGICAVLLYGISSGTIATSLLARMYAPMAMFSIASFYLHVKKWNEHGFAKKRGALIAVTVGGFLTQYFFLFFCIPLAAVTAVYLCIRKRYEELKNYVGSMIGAAVIGIGLFPFCIDDVFTSAFGTEITATLGSGFEGYIGRIVTFFGFLISGYFGNLIYGLVVLGILAVAVVIIIVKNKNRENTGDNLPLVLMMVIPVLCYVLFTAKSSVFIHDRYMMPMFPFLALGITLALGFIFSHVQKLPKYLMLVPVALFSIAAVLTYDREYLQEGYGAQVELAREYRALPCVCVYAWDEFYENVVEFVEYDKTLLVQQWEFEARADWSGLPENGEFIVLRKGSIEENQMLHTAAANGWELKEVLMSSEESSKGDTIYLFEVKGNAQNAAE